MTRETKGVEVKQSAQDIHTDEVLNHGWKTIRLQEVEVVQIQTYYKGSITSQ